MSCSKTALFRLRTGVPTFPSAPSFGLATDRGGVGRRRSHPTDSGFRYAPFLKTHPSLKEGSGYGIGIGEEWLCGGGKPYKIYRDE